MSLCWEGSVIRSRSGAAGWCLWGDRGLVVAIRIIGDLIIADAGPRGSGS